MSTKVKNGVEFVDSNYIPIKESDNETLEFYHDLVKKNDLILTISVLSSFALGLILMVLKKFVDQDFQILLLEVLTITPYLTGSLVLSFNKPWLKLLCINYSVAKFISITNGILVKTIEFNTSILFLTLYLIANYLWFKGFRDYSHIKTCTSRIRDSVVYFIIPKRQAKIKFYICIHKIIYTISDTTIRRVNVKRFKWSNCTVIDTGIEPSEDFIYELDRLVYDSKNSIYVQGNLSRFTAILKKHGISYFFNLK